MQVRLTGLQRTAMAETLKERINAACVKLYSEGPRSHLGASEIGEKCKRRLVYSFRWMGREVFDGRMLRLFNRGHREEDRIIEWLRAAGLTVHSHTPDGKQIRIFQDQHHGGSLDGVALLPPEMALDMPLVLEIKTHNWKSFRNLLANKVQLAKPKHFSQMSEYGWYHSIQYGLYFAVNKNDDDIYIEIVELDFAHGESLSRKAQEIVFATVLPGRVAGSAAHRDCEFCPMVPICHNGQPAEKNCRSCAHSRPVAGQDWHCAKFGKDIPKSEIPKGCPMWAEFGK